MVKSGIIINDYRKLKILTVQLDALQEAPLQKVEEQRHDVKSKFTKCSYRQGDLSLECKDQITANWLKGVTGYFTPYVNAELIALTIKNIDGSIAPRTSKKERATLRNETN